MSDTKIVEIRMVGHVYQLNGGKWSYFLRLIGPGKDETLHPELAWQTKDGAMDALKRQAKLGLSCMPKDAKITDQGAEKVTEDDHH
jgi:hypothetical protein